MLDGFGRTIDYLRVSVTDRCSLRCTYCMPEDGVRWLEHTQILRYEDILRLLRIFAALGETYVQIKRQQDIELDMEQWTSSKL